MERIESASLKELTEIDEIGGRIAESVQAYFSNPENIRLIERLKEKGLHMQLDEESIA